MLPRVLLTPIARETLLAAVRQAAPREAIGLLGGVGDAAADHAGTAALRVTSFLAVANTSTAADTFVVPAATFAAAAATLRARGEILLGFAHSHPAGSAMPSLQDRRELWRDCLHLIVAGDGAGPADWCAFRLTSRGVEPLPLEVA
ncbi:MAG: Mov34/MPN/PAD-1 family protein [Planctomycetes bacterium]|nr:Mov34/MPN/PAD-1 family protein [Planctomycetota bacterium]